MFQILTENIIGDILRVFSSSHKLDVGKLEVLFKSTYEYIVNSFPWISITPSLHKILAHSTEFIDKYNECGLKLYSEECIEALNKHVRHYRDKLARKHRLMITLEISLLGL